MFHQALPRNIDMVDSNFFQALAALPADVLISISGMHLLAGAIRQVAFLALRAALVGAALKCFRRQWRPERLSHESFNREQSVWKLNIPCLDRVCCLHWFVQRCSCLVQL